MHLHFLALHVLSGKPTISRFGKSFRDGQYSLVSFLFDVLLLKVPPRNCEWARAPVPMESASLDISYVA